MFLPTPTPVPLMRWCLADCLTTLLSVPGLEFPFALEGDEREGAGDGFHHVPVMLDEVVEFLAPAAGRTFIDATLGGAGHAAALLERGARLIGLDRDPEALDHARGRLARYGEAFVSRRANFSELLEVGRELAPGGVDGILLDLGVSSHQLDCAARGFSLRFGGPLDMRMDPAESLTAAEVVNEWDEEELARIFHVLGEERRSRAVARAIVRRRARTPFRETLDLADCVAGVVGRKGRIHPATRVFQALRMTVNRELEALEAALEAAPALLKARGRLAVITFHSLEDRLVKRFFRDRSVRELDRPEWPAPRPNPDCTLRVLTRRPVEASESEVKSNPRARSAKLRVAERLERGEA